MRNQQEKGPFEDIRSGLNILWLLINAYATAILPFMRKDFGVDFFGLNALVAIVVMLIFGAAENGDDLLRYMVLWLIVVAAQRADSWRAYRKGQIVHSYYAGDSWLAAKFSRKNKTIKLVVEPAICLLTGIFICPHSPGIGKFLIVGTFAVLAFNGFQRASMEQRVRRMRDAHIEQQATAQMFRQHDDDF